MSIFSRILSSPVDWDTADTPQKLASLEHLAADDPVLAKLAIEEGDPRVRQRAMERMAAPTLWDLVATVNAGDEDVLAACLMGSLDANVGTTGDLPGPVTHAPAALRVALVAHAQNEALALALVESLEQDGERASVARGKGPMAARSAAVRAIGNISLLDAIALEYRDRQRSLYRAAHDRAEWLRAAQAARAQLEALCTRLETLIAQEQLNLTAVVNIEREYQSITPQPDDSGGDGLQSRYARVLAQARELLQGQADIWRRAERLKQELASLAERSGADESVTPDGLAALVSHREACAAQLAEAAFDALPRERGQLRAAIERLTERHAVLAIECQAVAGARSLIAAAQDNAAGLTPAWRAELTQALAIVRPTLRAPLQAEADALLASAASAASQQQEAERTAAQQFRAEFETLLRQMEQCLDKGQHQQAGEVAEQIRLRREAAPAGRTFPPALEFRLKRSQDRLGRMNEWKRFGDTQAREALCREAEALAKRVRRQTPVDTSPAAGGFQPPLENFLWPVSPALPADTSTAGLPTPDAGHTADTAQEPATALTETSPQADSTSGTVEASPEAAGAGAGEGATEGGADAVTGGEPQAAQPDELLSPEAIAQAVRELQARWQKLDAGKGASSKGLWQRFRRACDQAYAPARKHFEALEQERSQNAGKKAALLERLAALNERIVDGADWGRILSERGELVRGWFEGGSLPRRQARDMMKRFDTLSRDIDAKLEARRQAERVRRRALIEEARTIAERPADGASMASMIALQKRWQEGMKGVIRLKAGEDKALWDAFRSAGSALFGKRDAEKAAQQAEREAQLGERRAIIDEMQALARSSDAAAIRRGMDDIGARWQAQPWPERKPLREVEQKFAAARKAAQDRLGEIRNEAANQQRAAAMARLDKVEQAEQLLASGGTPDLDAVRAELQASLGEGEKLDTRVTARLASLEAAIKAGPDAWRADAGKHKAERDALLLELEIVLDLPSPAELSGERRMRMLKRLAESKNSRATPPLMPPGVPQAVERLLAMPMATSGVENRVNAVLRAAGKAPR
jgi:hypothetical protein